MINLPPYVSLGDGEEWVNKVAVMILNFCYGAHEWKILTRTDIDWLSTQTAMQGITPQQFEEGVERLREKGFLKRKGKHTYEATHHLKDLAVVSYS